MAEAALKQADVILFPQRQVSGQYEGEYIQAKNYDTERHEGRNGLVQPIRSKEDIKRIANYFWEREEYRNWCLFLMGIHTAFRASDLLRIRVKDVAEIKDNKLCVKEKSTIRLKEKKTGKYREIELPSVVVGYIATYFEKVPMKYDGWLFPSQKGSLKNSLRTNGGVSIGESGKMYKYTANPKVYADPLDVDSFGKIMRRAQKDLNLPYKLGTHSCRKTFGYWFMQSHKEDAYALAWLQKVLNHSSQSATLHYIGVSAEDENEFINSIDYGV